MEIAVFSDSHDHLELLEQAIAQAKERGIRTGFHLGDFCMPYVFELLGESGLEWHTVWGNNDGDRIGLEHTGSRYPNLHIGEETADLTLGGRTLFLTHYPRFANLAAASGQYDAVFHGHSHQIRNEYIGKTLIANPGAVSGIRTAKRPTFGIYNTDGNSFEVVDIRPQLPLSIDF